MTAIYPTIPYNVTQIGDRVRLEWAHPHDYFDPDIQARRPWRDPLKYEVRRGPSWFRSQYVCRTICNVLEVPIGGVGTEKYFVRAVSDEGGWYADAAVELEITTAHPPDNLDPGTRVEETEGGGWPGTKTNTQVDVGGGLELAAGQLTGTYTDTIDLGADADWLLGWIADPTFVDPQMDTSYLSRPLEQVVGPLENYPLPWEELFPYSNTLGDYLPDTLWRKEHDSEGNIYCPAGKYHIQVVVNTAASAPAAADYREFRPGVYSGRYAHLKITLEREVDNQDLIIQSFVTSFSRVASGGVEGPVSSTDKELPVFSGTGGDTLDNSGITADLNPTTSSMGIGVNFPDPDVNTDMADSTFLGKDAGDGVSAFALNPGSLTLIGARAGQRSTSASAVAIGGDAWADSNAALSVCIGPNAGRFAVNVEAAGPQYMIAIGGNALRSNSGNFCSALGGYAGIENRGEHLSAVGWRAGRLNIGARCIAHGLRALEANEGYYNVALGAWSFRDFTNGTEFTFDSTAITTGDPSSINVPGHGLTVGLDYLIRYEKGTGTGPTAGGTELPGEDPLGHLENVYIFNAVDANNLEFVNVILDGAGTGTGHSLFTKGNTYTNAIAIGYEAEPDADNQCFIGNTSLTSIRTHADLQVLDTSGADLFSLSKTTADDGFALALYQETPGIGPESVGIVGITSGLIAAGPVILATGLAHGDTGKLYDVQATDDGILVAVEPPPASWSVSDTDTGDYDLGTGTGVGPWVQMTGLTVTIPQSVGAGERVNYIIDVMVVNKTTNRSGTIEIGAGINGAQPTAGTARSVPAGWAGIISIAGVASGPLNATDDIGIWGRRASGSHSQFGVDLEGSTQQHEFDLWFSPSAQAAAGSRSTTEPVAADAEVLQLCDATSAPITLTLPEAVKRIGAEFEFKKIDSTGNAVTVEADGSETIDGSPSVVLGAQWDFVRIKSDGNDWFVVGN